MKKFLYIIVLLLPSLSLSAADKSKLLQDDPSPRLPQKETTKTDEAELLFQNNNSDHQSVEGKQVKENQEDIDPIFYDATTSPAELNNAD